ncbi:hypothetical protein EG329_002654 [Mollisiaceae sp. DMI_Dod_QoI]|nr:hypothetical protein EG329_002654 [Helotiales sp. DMI_Dod_QoI]
MAFQNQFSLSLELTRLVPLAMTLAGKTYEAAMNLARDLQASGSDIVVEADILELFGHSRISDNISSSFRTIMSRTDPPESLSNGIFLFKGAGPTVLRALSDVPYFSTIVQCSFLTEVHDRSSLATSLTRYLGQRAEEASEDSSVRAAPSFELVRGMLQACEDQTASYGWRNQLLAVAAKLEFVEWKIYETIPEAILHGLISMLPLVQHFPEDRYIVIKSSRGACSIIVWASLLLGLNVLVRVYLNDEVKEVRFGSLPEQVLIEISSKYRDLAQANMKSPEITLLSSSTMEELFKLKSNEDEDMLSATHKRPARGFAKRVIEAAVSDPEWSGRIGHEMKLVSIGFALCIAKKLCIPIETQQNAEFRVDKFVQGSAPSHFRASVPSTPEQYTPPLPYSIQNRHILGAARILFNDETLQLRTGEEYASLYSGRSPWRINSPPTSVRLILKEMNFEEEDGLEDIFWIPLRHKALATSLLVLAFAHIADMDSAADLPMCEIVELLQQSELYKALRSWDGETQIPIHESVWLQIMALFMTGQSEIVKDLKGTCLLSNYGWSLFVNTFGASDPSYISMFNPT